MKILFVSLGCDKNLVDSEVMLGLLQDAGYTFTDVEEEADVIVVNTCSFIHDAKEESVQTILDMAEYKKTGNLKALIVSGCLAERYKEEMKKEIPEVDAVIGTNSYDEIVHAVEAACKHEYFECCKPLSGIPQTQTNRVLSTPSHYGYLKIAEGCAKHCTYCIIPTIRGRFRSIPMEELLRQANQMAKDGVRELILVAQETTLYGTDLYGKKTLPELLNKLSEIPGIFWIRILYCYPEEITDELIATIKENPKVCHYLDLPIQHASDEILKRMGRKTSQADLRTVIGKLRKEIPDIALRTTMIAGFPGETEEDHKEAMGFIDELEFDRLGAFTYSQEEGTPAASMDNQVDEETKTRWRNEIMALQEEVSADINKEMIGSVFDVIIDGMVPGENTYVGRTYRDTPDVDGYLFVTTSKTMVSGEIVKVKITGAYEYDLIGELADEFTE